MASQVLEPGKNLARLFQGCETFCDRDCCGLDAFDFSPLRVAAHLSHYSGAIAERDVRTLIEELDALQHAGSRCVPNEQDFICSISGTNQLFTAQSLSELLARLRWALGAAPAVLACSDKLENDFVAASS